MVDKVKPLKLESSSLGGTENDEYQTEINPQEDYLSAKGVSFENSDLDKIDLSSDLNVQAPALAGLLLHKNSVPNDTKNYIVSAEHNALFFEDFFIDGELTLDGDLVGIA